MQGSRAEDGVTVVVPVLNRSDQLRRAVSSVLCEAPYSVVIVDDGSLPEFGAVATEIAAKSGGLVEAIHQPNRGPAAARNAGLRRATSRFLLFLDSDDEFAHGASTAISSALLAHDDVGLLCGTVRVASPDGGSRFDFPTEAVGFPGADLSRLSGSFVVRADVARAVGGYDEALRFGENTDFILRVADECRRRSLRVVATTDVLAVYHAASDERRYDSERLDAVIHLLHRGRFDLEVRSERARLHAIAAVNAARVGRYGISVKHGVLAVLAEPRNPRHLGRLAVSFSGPLARRRWLDT